MKQINEFANEKDNKLRVQHKLSMKLLSIISRKEK